MCFGAGGANGAPAITNQNATPQQKVAEAGQIATAGTRLNPTATPVQTGQPQQIGAVIATQPKLGKDTLLGK